MNRKKAIVGSALVFVAVMLLANNVQAGSGYSQNSDSWGNKIQIWSSYNQYGGTVSVDATALYIGGEVGGIEIGMPIFYGESLTVNVYGYVGNNLVYSSSYTYSNGWQYTYSHTFNLPGGLTAVNVNAYATFFSIPFGNSQVTCNLYS
jgi:hypothetical protein